MPCSIKGTSLAAAWAVNDNSKGNAVIAAVKPADREKFVRVLTKLRMAIIPGLVDETQIMVAKDDSMIKVDGLGCT
jgi:hypothetical protein